MAKGDLIVSYQDNIKIKPDTLQRFYDHYVRDKNACVGAVGDQYSSFDPPIKTWTDPRKTDKYGSYYEIVPIDIEFSLCAIPRQAIYDVGGMDEEYDRGAAVGEKEMMLRIDKLGYKTYIDQSIEYMALSHPRLSKDWDKYYKIASDIYSRHVTELRAGTRQLHLGYLSLTR